MAEEKWPQEGWAMGWKLPLVALLGLVAILFGAVLLLGRFYDARVQEKVRVRRDVVAAAPRLETDHAPVPLRKPPPALVARAMAESAQAGWPAGAPR